MTTTTHSYAAQRDEFVAGLSGQAPAEVVDPFGRSVGSQTAVDYAGRAPKVDERAPGFSLPDQVERQASLAQGDS